MPQWDINEIGVLYRRPWGNYRTIEQKANYQIKHIVVYPGKRTSSQFHRHRDEILTVIKGSGIITLGRKVHIVKIGTSIKIPIEATHRITNDTDEDFELIEVQVGDYLGEDDIVRFKDQYGR